MPLKNSGRISVQRTSSLIHAPTPPSDRLGRIIYAEYDISGCEFHLKHLPAMQCWKKILTSLNFRFCIRQLFPTCFVTKLSYKRGYLI